MTQTCIFEAVGREMKANDVLLVYKAAYYGQVSPKYPDAEERAQGSTPNGKVVQISDGVTAQGGPFGSVWFRLWSQNVWKAELVPNIVALLETDKPNFATYVIIPEQHIEGLLIRFLKENNFKYYFYEKDSESLVYYHWKGPLPDLVPEYASARGGVGVLILDPSEEEVFLVHEYGWWKPVTGSVDPNEDKVETCLREAREEAGMVLERSTAYFVGGWHHWGRWDHNVNDEFSTFVIRAKSKEFSVDGHEVKKAAWFKIADLPLEKRMLGDPLKEDEASAIMIPEGKITPKVFQWLWNYKNGRCLSVVTENGRSFFN